MKRNAKPASTTIPTTNFTAHFGTFAILVDRPD